MALGRDGLGLECLAQCHCHRLRQGSRPPLLTHRRASQEHYVVQVGLEWLPKREVLLLLETDFGASRRRRTSRRRSLFPPYASRAPRIVRSDYRRRMEPRSGMYRVQPRPSWEERACTNLTPLGMAPRAQRIPYFESSSPQGNDPCSNRRVGTSTPKLPADQIYNGALPDHPYLAAPGPVPTRAMTAATTIHYYNHHADAFYQ